MKTYGRRKTDSNNDGDIDVVNLDEVCRLCLGREEREEHRVSIFANAQREPVPLALRIMACVALEVVEEDGLPNTICRPCHYQLEKYYIFRKKCKSSDIKLRMHLKQLSDAGGSAFSMEDDVSDGESPRNEQDLVGASVTIIIPEEDENDMEIDDHNENKDQINQITLPPDSPNDTRQACTLKQELLEEEDKDDDRHIILEKSNVKNDSIEIATTSVDSGDSSEKALSVRVLPSLESELTHVEVTTEDGSVLLMELSTVDVCHDGPNDSNVKSGPAINDAGEYLVFKCEECPKAFPRMVELKRHMSVHNSQRGITCGVCEKWFPTHSSYTRHERIHTGSKPFQCSICERRFIQKEILLRHMLTHSEVKPFNCHICKKGFTQKDTLRIHLEKHEPKRTVQLHRCPLCPKVFCHASGLSRHVLVHSGRGYKCADCEKIFNDKSSLKRHHKISGHQMT